MFFEFGLLTSGSFQKKMSKNVYWIPIRNLGDRSYDLLADYENISRMDIKQKKQKIKTLYDAILVFICSNMRKDLYSKKLSNAGIEWEFYQSGEEAVLNNYECCTSCASWLAYMLADVYEEVGLFLIIRYAMTGHCMNYIRHNNEIYFIDMQTFIQENLQYRALETGNLKDFINSKYITNIFIKATSFEDYVAYHKKLTRNVVSDAIFVKIPSDTCIPIGLKENDYGVVYLPENYNYEIIESTYNFMKYEIVELNFTR